MIESLRSDVRIGLRMLARSRGFSAVVALTLGLGIGANTAIFSVVEAVLLRPLPYAEPDRLVQVHEANPRLGSGIHPVSFPTFADWREHNQVFTDLAAYRTRIVSLSGRTRPEQGIAVAITPSLPSVLGREPLLGRGFGPTADGRDAVALISHGLWQRRYGGRADVVGESLAVDGRRHTIVGVMPLDFTFPTAAVDCWLPLETPRTGDRGNHILRVVGRLAPGVAIGHAETEMDALVARLVREAPELEGWDTAVQPLTDVVVGDVAPALWVLWGAVAFVMLVVCATLANLVMTRSLARQRELAIRTALGAGPARLMRLLVTETVLLAAVGGVLAVLVAMWIVPPLVALSGGGIPRAETIGIDGSVLSFTAGLSLLTGAALGLLQWVQVVRCDSNAAVRGGGRMPIGASNFRLRGSLVVGELAVALILLVGTGLMLRTLWELRRVDPGFHPDRLLTFRVQLPEASYPEAHQAAGFYQALLDRLAALPEVDSVGGIDVLPLLGTSYRGFRIVGRPPEAPDAATSALFRVIAPEYLATMGIRVLDGRGLTRFDTEDSPPVALVNEAFARRYFPNRDSLGARLDLGTPVEIVGVVGDVRHLGLDSQPSPTIYRAMRQSPGVRSLALVARTGQAPLDLVPGVHESVTTLDSSLPVHDVMTGSDLAGSSVTERRFVTTLLAIFAAAAALLASLGIYGVMAYSTSLRAHEIGVRVALGARHRDVLGVVLVEGLALALGGVGLGLVGAFALTRLLRTLLFGVAATDPLTLGVAVGLLLGAASLATYLPARRAARISPVEVLR